MGRQIKDLRAIKLGPKNQLTPLWPTKERKRTHTVWLCQCSCGKLCKVASDQLTQNRTRSCGCLYTKSLKVRRNKKTERNQALICMYKEGSSIDELKRIFNISQPRVCQIIKQYKQE